MMKKEEKQRIAVTGADGFVGSALCRRLGLDDFAVRPIVRDESCALRYLSMDIQTEAPVVVGDIGSCTDWSLALDEVDVVIHLAARVHVMNENEEDPLSAFREVNTEGTRGLAIASAHAGVRRLVFVSTIKVNGETTTGRGPLRPEEPACPQDPYGVSKWEAELSLAEVAAATGLETVIMRPPLVHGPGVAGNLRRLILTVNKGIPLPLSRVNNRRSLVGVDNLVDALALCAVHKAAPGGVYTVCDGEQVSTAELIRIIAKGLRKPARLFPCPVAVLVAAASMFGKRDAVDRLVGSLEVDDSKLRRELGWYPVKCLEDGITAMCDLGSSSQARP